MPKLLLNPRVLLALGVMNALLVVLLAVWSVRRGDASEPGVYGEMPAFTLTDQEGRQVASSDVRGKVVVANFVYTHCTDTCPALSARMRLLQEHLRKERLLGDPVQLLSFSTDPARDIPSVLRAYADERGADPAAWRFLTGPPETVTPLVVKGFQLGVQKAPLEEATPHVHIDGSEHRHIYEVIHSNKFVLIDRQGYIRAYYDGLALDPRAVERDIRQLR